MPNFFSKKIKSKLSPKLEMPFSIPPQNERRRAVRIDAPDIQVKIKMDDQQVSYAKITDMSTLGIAILLDSIPDASQAEFSFSGSPSLTGLIITGRKKHTEIVGEKNQYKIGYEFVFTSAEQQTRLLRWLCSYLQSQSSPTFAKDQTKAPSYSASFYSDIEGEFQIRFPLNQKEYEQVLQLIPQPSLHHTLLQTKFFVLLHEENVIAVIPLIPDILAFKLPADYLFLEYADSLRSSGRRMAEVCLPLFKEDLLFLKNPSFSSLRKLRILFAVFPYIVSYARKFAFLTDLIALVPPHLEEFFHLWMFKELGPQSHVVERQSGQIRKGFRLMWLNFQTLDHHLESERPELYTNIEQSEHMPEYLAAFQNSYFPDAETFKKCFVKENSILNRLKPDQSHYFRTLFPDLSLPS